MAMGNRAVDECMENFQDIAYDRMAELESIFEPFLNLETGQEQLNPGFTKEQREVAQVEHEALLRILSARYVEKTVRAHRAAGDL